MGANEIATTDEAAIRDLLETWARAVRAKDYERILAHHSPELLMFDVPPPFQSKGLQAYRQTWDLFFSVNSAPVVFDFDEMDINAGTSVAYVTALMHCEPPRTAEARLDFL
jgi:ketosteroid isomerase-like protein